MLGLFSAVKNTVPIGKKIGWAKTEGPISVLHYRATTLLFLCCCVLVTSLEWIGNGANITCAMSGPSDDWNIPVGVINSYCYIQSTFTIPGPPTGVEHVTAHPGVGPTRSRSDVKGPEEKHKAYYQWVSFMLFLQAGLFYFPHLLYKTWEGGKIANIISGLHHVILDKGVRQSREKILARYLLENMNNSNMWGVRLFLVRFVYFFNVIFNIVFIDIFLEREFSSYGLQVIDLMEDDPIGRPDPMSRIFPKVTKCTMRKFGPTGNIQNHDAICVLPINIINEKIYVVLWFWLAILGLITLLSLIYNTFVIVTPSLRNMLLRKQGAHKHGLSQQLDDISRHTQFGDWMVLYMLCQNLEPMVWGELIEELHLLIKDANHNTEGEQGQTVQTTRVKTPLVHSNI